MRPLQSVNVSNILASDYSDPDWAVQRSGYAEIRKRGGAGLGAAELPRLLHRALHAPAARRRNRRAGPALECGEDACLAGRGRPFGALDPPGVLDAHARG